MKAYKGTFNAATSTGNQTISGIVDEDGNSFTPKAMFVWTTYGTSAAFADGWTFMMSVTDGTNSNSSCTAASDNVAAQRAESVRSTSMVRIINSAGTVLRVGAFSSFGSGQVVINWTTVDASAEIFHYIAFGGSDLSVLEQSIIFDDTSVTARSVATLATLAGVLSLGAFGSPSAGGTGSNVGWYVPRTTGAFDQGVAAAHIRDNVNPSQCARYERTSEYKALFTAASTSSLFGAASRDIFGDIFSTIGAGSSNVFTHMLAFGNIAMAAGNGLQPTSTGTQAISGLGFSPKAVIVVSVGAAASTSTGSEARLSVGGSDRTRQGHTVAGSAHGVTPSVCVVNEDTSHVVSCITPNATAASSTTEAQASVNSIDSDGFTLNWNAADATQREYIWLAFGDPTPATTGEKSTTFVGTL